MRRAPLRSLDLYGCSSLASLPAEVGALGSLTELDLRGCRSLASLPAEVGALSSLMWLNLRGCRKLASLPAEIRQMKGCKIVGGPRSRGAVGCCVVC